MNDSTVWILGAGFSRSLGGPLLPDLFSKGADQRVLSAFPHLNHIPGPINAYRLYQEHYSANEVRLPLWTNAEEFLEKLELVVAEGEKHVSHQLLVDSCTGSLNLVREADRNPDFFSSILHGTKQFLAAECALFTRNVDLRSERWNPYVEWARRLSEDDCVITMNYDVVLELINLDAQNFQFSLPPNISGRGCGLVPVVKLHGSLNWKLESGKYVDLKDRLDFAVDASKDEIAIATPGISKINMSRQPDMKTYWGLAQSRIEDAKRIVFLGYRIPESDSWARTQLVKAISRSRSLPRIRTVLGADVVSHYSQRLLKLLELVAKKSEADVKPLPLYAEDFVAVCHDVDW